MTERHAKSRTKPPLLRAPIPVTLEELESLPAKLERYRLPRTAQLEQLFRYTKERPLAWDRASFRYGRRTVEYEFEGAEFFDDYIELRLGDKTKSL